MSPRAGFLLSWLGRFDVLQGSGIAEISVKPESGIDAKRTGQHDHVLKGVIGEVRKES